MRPSAPEIFRQGTELRRQVLIATVGITFGWALVVTPLGLFDVLPLGPMQSLNNALLLTATAGLLPLLLKHPRAFKPAGACFFAMVFYVGISAQFFALNDYFRPLLFFPIVGAVFLIFGSGAGWGAVALSLGGFAAAVVHGNLPANLLGISTFVLTLCVTAFLFHLFRYQAMSALELVEAQNLALDKTAREDPLTGLLNLRAFRAEMAAWEQGDETFAIAFLDIDHFKAINDQYGHDGGDALLVSFARRLIETCRPLDVVGRIGGEEFAILMRCRDNQEAEVLGERLRSAIATATMELDGDALTVTASIGVALRDSVPGANPLKAADGAMYLAKRCGRNRVVIAGDQQTPQTNASH